MIRLFLIRFLSVFPVLLAGQLCSWAWLKMTIFFRIKVLKRSVPLGFPTTLSTARVAAAIGASAVYVGCMREVFNIPASLVGLVLLILIQIALSLDIWIEVIPFELILTILGVAFLYPIFLTLPALSVISFAVTAAFLSGVSMLCGRFAGRDIFAAGDMLFCSAYSSIFGFVAGIASFGSGLVLAGLFAVFARDRLKTTGTIPLVPFICLAHAAIVCFNLLFV